MGMYVEEDVKRTHSMMKPTVTAGSLLLGLIVGLMGGAAVWGLDVADMTPEWTPEGKKLAMERAKLPTKEEMVRIPAGPFLMGSTRRQDKNSYQPEFPQQPRLLGCV